jgi:glucose-6-phosphate 1-dehydrogenase
MEPTVLTIRIQPNEGMHLQFETKVPGAGITMRSVDMEFHYLPEFGGDLPDAYERLLLDVLQGDASLFARSDEIELAWSLIDPIIEGWESDTAPELAFYESGSWGPDVAHDLLARDGRAGSVHCGYGTPALRALLERATDGALAVARAWKPGETATRSRRLM